MAAARTPRLEVLLSVSRRVAEGSDLGETLDHIACEAAAVTGAVGASIQLIGREGRLWLGGAWGVSEVYRRHLEARFSGFGSWAGPTGLAITRRRQVVVPDIQAHPDLAGWADWATAEGYHSLCSTPLDVEGDVLGALNLYRPRAGAWPEGDLEVLSFFSDHAATALRIANLIDRQNRQLAGFARIVRDLREQTHEHANRIHSIAALMAMGERAEAQRFISELLRAHGESHDAVVRGIEHPALAGLLLAEMMIARQTGIDLKVDRRSRLTSLPARLSEAESVALVAHMLEHAFEAVVGVPASRRRVTLRAWSGERGAVFRVRDWGLAPPSVTQPVLVDGAVFSPSSSSHRLPSLTQSLLLEAVSGVQGSVQFTPERTGTTTVVTIPATPLGGAQADTFSSVVAAAS